MGVELIPGNARYGFDTSAGHFAVLRSIEKVWSVIGSIVSWCDVDVGLVTEQMIWNFKTDGLEIPTDDKIISFCYLIISIE